MYMYNNFRKVRTSTGMEPSMFVFVFVVVVSCGVLAAPPRHHSSSSTESSSHDDDSFDGGLDKLEYGRYMQEVLQLLENDKNFKAAIEKASAEDIQSGKVAEDLRLVDSDIRDRLNEQKRYELERLDDLHRQLSAQRAGDGHQLPRHHIDHQNTHSFTEKDLKRLILQAQHDLQKLEELRKKQYREHEMEKQFEYEQSLKGVDEKTKQERVKKHEEEEKRKKQKEESAHHPLSKDQLEDVWEGTDHLDAENFDPKVFFQLHDLNGDGYWNQDEIGAVLSPELSKMNENGDFDAVEQEEQMNEMIQYTLAEVDQDKDGFISWEEFERSIRRGNDEHDPGWKRGHEEPPFKPSEYEEYVRKHTEQIQKQIDAGRMPGNQPQGYQLGMPPAHGQRVPQFQQQHGTFAQNRAALNAIPPNQQQTWGQPGVPLQSQGVPQQSLPLQGHPGVPQQGVPSQGQQGVPLQGQQGVPLQGQQGVPLQGHPGVPQQGVPLRGHPGVPQQGVPLQGHPGVPQQGVPLQGHPGVPQQGVPLQGHAGVPQQGVPLQGHAGVPQRGVPPQGHPVDYSAAVKQQQQAASINSLPHQSKQ